MTAQELKDFCKSQNLTYKELGELIGYSESAIKSALAKNEISEPMTRAIQMQLEITDLKKQLKEFDDFKDFIKRVCK